MVIGAVRNGRGHSRRSGRRTASQRPRVRVKAPEYVAKMDVDGGKVSAIRALAEQFETKAFLPRGADIRNFCHIHGIDDRVSKSRAGAIPRLFKYLATMDPDELQRLLDDGAFSGPSRLGPLAEAIREHGRADRHPCTVQEGEQHAVEAATSSPVRPSARVLDPPFHGADS